MHSTCAFFTTLAAGCLFMSSASAGLLQARDPNSVTVFEHIVATAVPVANRPQPTDCPDMIVTVKEDCESTEGCTAAGIAGMVGIARDSWTCMSIPVPKTSWTSVRATSTCSPGSTVHTYVVYGGETELACKATDAA